MNEIGAKNSKFLLKLKRSCVEAWNLVVYSAEINKEKKKEGAFGFFALELEMLTSGWGFGFVFSDGRKKDLNRQNDISFEMERLS